MDSSFLAMLRSLVLCYPFLSKTLDTIPPNAWRPQAVLNNDHLQAPHICLGRGDGGKDLESWLSPGDSTLFQNRRKTFCPLKSGVLTPDVDRKWATSQGQTR